jgi:hypothetical protein
VPRYVILAVAILVSLIERHYFFWDTSWNPSVEQIRQRDWGIPYVALNLLFLVLIWVPAFFLIGAFKDRKAKGRKPMA